MNERNPEEIRYRRRAFKLFDKEKSPTEILAPIPRSRSWLGKWKQRVEQAGWAAVDSRSQAPQPSPHAYPLAAVKVVVRIRPRFAKRPVGQVGARAIRQERLRHRWLTSGPSVKTLTRGLKAADLRASPSEPGPEAYYPAPRGSDAVVLRAWDWTERYFTGGAKVFGFHTIAHRSHALVQPRRSTTSTASTRAHLLEGCAQ
jgi:hypothetical protein